MRMGTQTYYSCGNYHDFFIALNKKSLDLLDLDGKQIEPYREGSDCRELDYLA